MTDKVLKLHWMSVLPDLHIDIECVTGLAYRYRVYYRTCI